MATAEPEHHRQRLREAEAQLGRAEDAGVEEPAVQGERREQRGALPALQAGAAAARCRGRRRQRVLQKCHAEPDVRGATR